MRLLAPILSLALLVLTLTLMTSCGVPICVAGIGNCSAYFDKQGEQPEVEVTPTPDPNDALTISGASTISLTAPTTTYTVTGGSGVYTFTVNPVGCGVFNTFTPGLFTATLAATCIITVTDTSTPIRNGTFSVTVTL